MVTKEQAKASQDASKKKDDEAQKKIKNIVDNSKQSKFDNMGYNYSNTGGRSDDNTPNPVNAIGQKDQVTQLKEAQAKADEQAKLQLNNQQEIANQQSQQKSNYNTKFLEDTAKAGDQKSIDELRRQGRNVYRVKEGTYDRVYIDKVPDDVANQIETGYTDKQGNYQNNYYVKDDFSKMISAGSDAPQTNPLDEAVSKPYQGFSENVGFSGAGSTAIVSKSVKKTRIEDTGNDELVKQFGVDKANEIIENRNRIIEKNNLMIKQDNAKKIDDFIISGKEFGFKQVQIKSKDRTSFVSIDDKNALLNAGADSEFTFVKTPEMRKYGRDVRTEQKKFITDSKNFGSKFLVESKNVNGKTVKKVIPIDQGYKEMIRNPDATFSNVPVVPEGYAIGGSIGSNILVSTEKPKLIESNYSPDPFSKLVQGLDEYNPFTPDKNIQGAKKPSDFEQAKYTIATSLADFGSILTGGANLVKSGIQKISPSYMAGIGVAYQKDNPVQAWTFSPLKAGAELLSEPSPDIPPEPLTNQTSSETLSPEKIKELEDFENFKIKQKEKNEKWSLKDYYQKQQETYDSYKGAVIKEGTKSSETFYKQPFAKQAGDVIGFVGSTIMPTRGITKLAPLKYTSTPFLTSVGEKTISQSLRVGYGEGKLLVIRYPETNKLFFGKQQPKYSGIEKIEGTSGKNSFETYEFSDYSKRQMADLKPIVNYGEKTGIIEKTDMEKALFHGQVKKEIVASKDMFKYEKTISPKEIEKDFVGIKGSESLSVLSSEQKLFKDKSAFLKGSGTINTLKDGIKTTRHDIDISVSSDKKGQRLSDKLFQVGAKEGYELKQSGKNISVSKKGSDKFQDVFNIVTPKEERVSAVKRLNKNTFYGDKIKTGKISQTIEGTTKKIKSQDFAQQVIDWGRSTSGIVSKRTLEGYRGDQTQFKNIFDTAKVRIGFPLFHRAEKDITRDYFWGLRESARFAWQSGNKPLAYKIGQSMKLKYETYKNIIDWKTSIKNLRQEGKIELVKGTKIDSLNKFYSDYGKTIEQGAYAGSSFYKTNTEQSKNNSVLSFKSKSNFATLTTKQFINNLFEIEAKDRINYGKKLGYDFSKIINNEKNKAILYNELDIYPETIKKDLIKINTKSLMIRPNNKSIFSSTKSITSVKSSSVSFIKSAKSIFSPSTKSVSSVKSLSTKSVSSVKSLSTKSASITSSKSPSLKSPSLGSPSLKSPSLGSPSLKSPSLKSPSLGSPSLKSPSLGSPSLGSPSLGSPSLKSPSLKFPPSIFPPYKEPPPFVIPKLFFGMGKKHTYFDKRKPSITFRWGVNNPIFKKFSIKEGKGNRTIEW